jgi:cysteinyl-tRNA synthetase
MELESGHSCGNPRHHVAIAFDPSPNIAVAAQLAPTIQKPRLIRRSASSRQRIIPRLSQAMWGMCNAYHTGGIDHREIHHPNEIAQNQAYTCSCHPGASFWMHNNFLVNRSGKLSKSAGGALLIGDLVERGYHPLAFRMMCLQAHYRRELEFSFTSLGAALTRLKRIVIALEGLRRLAPSDAFVGTEVGAALFHRFDAEIADDLMTPRALPILEEVLERDDIAPAERLALVRRMDEVLGFRFDGLSRVELRIRPAGATLDEAKVEAQLAARRILRNNKEFAEADRARSLLEETGVVVLDGDPLGWEWRVTA